MRTRLSEPADANRFWGIDWSVFPFGTLGVDDATDGAQDIAFAPVPCAGKMDASVDPSSED
jgi:hypothetical protein